MKKLFLILIGCVCLTSMSAQTISKGTVMANTTLSNLSFNSVTIGFEGDKTSSSRFGLQATGGYAIMDDLAVIAGVGFQSAGESDSRANVLDCFVGARYYVIPNVYAGAKLAFGNVKLSLGDEDIEELISGSVGGSTFGVELNAGYTYFLTDRFAIEPGVSYYYGISNKLEDSKFNLSMLSFNVGFIYLF